MKPTERGLKNLGMPSQEYWNLPRDKRPGAQKAVKPIPDPSKMAFPMIALGNCVVGKAEYDPGDVFDALRQRSRDYLVAQGAAEDFVEPQASSGATVGEDTMPEAQTTQPDRAGEPAKGTSDAKPTRRARRKR